MKDLKNRIKSSSQLTALAHYTLKPKNQYRPRWWVRNFLNPFRHKRGNGTIIARHARMDLMPYNHFETGDQVLIEDFATINNAVGEVIIGDRSLIGLSSVVIGPVIIGNDVMLAQNVVLSGLNHSYVDVRIPVKDQMVTTNPIRIKDGAWIGANVVVIAGVTIGKNAVVAGGSTVTRNVPDYTVVVGNPARIVKQYCFESEEWVTVK